MMTLEGYLFMCILYMIVNYWSGIGCGSLVMRLRWYVRVVLATNTEMLSFFSKWFKLLTIYKYWHNYLLFLLRVMVQGVCGMRSFFIQVGRSMVDFFFITSCSLRVEDIILKVSTLISTLIHYALKTQTVWSWNNCKSSAFNIASVLSILVRILL